MKIIVDAMGGDNAPQAIVQGALDAHRECGVDILLVGRAAEVLRYTPSGVNQLVTAFENELGFSVFRRRTKGVDTTEMSLIQI